MSERRKFVSELWLVVAIILFVPAALIGAVRTFEAMSTLLLNYRTGTWTVVEAQEEFHMTRLAAAQFQIARVAKARGMTREKVRQIVALHTEKRFLGILGEPVVHVLKVNMTLDESSSQPGTGVSR